MGHQTHKCITPSASASELQWNYPDSVSAFPHSLDRALGRQSSCNIPCNRRPYTDGKKQPLLKLNINVFSNKMMLDMENCYLDLESFFLIKNIVLMNHRECELKIEYSNSLSFN